MAATIVDASSPRQGQDPLPEDAARPARILLVDDRQDKLLALESILGDAGQEVVKATSGREALRRCLEEDFAVVLLDVNMPGLDGFETATLIRQRPRSEKTPIIFITALSDNETHVSRGYSLGAVDYIRAPVDPEILKAKVAVFVDLYNKTEQVQRQAERMRQLQESRLAVVHGRLEAETKRNRFFTLAVDMLAIAGFDGYFKQLNPAWERSLGFSEQELLSRPLVDYVHGDDRLPTAEILDGLTEGAAPEGAYFENRYRHRAGDYRWLGWTAVPFPEEGLIYVFARDITERKVAEEERLRLIREQAARAAAEAAERRANFLAEAGSALASSLDERAVASTLARLAVSFIAEWCLIDVKGEDGRVRRVEAVHADAARAGAMRRLLDSPFAAEGRSPQRQAIESGESQLLTEVPPALLAEMAPEEHWRGLLEELKPGAVMVVPLAARGRSFGAVTLASSVHEYGPGDLRLAEDLGRRAGLAADNAYLYRASQEARLAAERANRAKDEFLATLSHELRTPLTPILGWTVMLRSGNLDAAGRERGLEVIERNVRVQTQLIEDLLDVSRIITGKLRVDTRPIDLAPVVEAGLDAVRPAAEAKEISFVTHLDAKGARVVGDPDRLQQVVWNLASNAVKFTPRGGRVEVGLETVDGSVRLSVRDTGRGIDADFLPHVFDRFRQADSTSTRKYGGLGLGLAIVRHLVELHGGSVHAASPGQDLGSIFTVTLPLLDDDPARAGLAGAEGSHGPVTGRLDGLRVMVVHDDADRREFLRAWLQRQGAQVSAPGSHAEALESVRSQPPDVLVSEVGRPDRAGYDLIRRLRSLTGEEGARVPAVALAPRGSAERAQALAAGYQAHLAEPVEPAELVSTVADLAAGMR